MTHLEALALESLKAALRDGVDRNDPDFIAAMKMTVAERFELSGRLMDEALASGRYDVRERRFHGNVFLL
ncbi:MAG: hypothetical protein AAGA95_04100 [Pseudomonadota bacterium]